MARKFQNVSGLTQVFYGQPITDVNKHFVGDPVRVTVEADEIIEGDQWEKYAGPGGPLKELLHSKSDSSNAPAA